jgi:hypothetical protein
VPATVITRDRDGGCGRAITFGMLLRNRLECHDNNPMPSPILSDYLGEIARIRATRAGTGEISYYGALAGALNEAGQRLKPRLGRRPPSLDSKRSRDGALTQRQAARVSRFTNAEIRCRRSSLRALSSVVI